MPIRIYPQEDICMSKKKHKFDLTHLVQTGALKNDQMLFFVSDPGKSCKLAKQPNGEYKVVASSETMTLHAFAQKCLGMDPPDHATKWVRTESGKSLYELWHAEEEEDLAA
jgi:hypothetical protein